MSEILAQTAGAAYITRQMALDLPSIIKTKKAIKRAFMVQMADLGYASVEVLSTCNTNWNMSPWDSMLWAKEHMVATFPLGDFKVTDEVRALKVR
jgi:2-oxoglutarate ferredoxin oxidoreductase subunit beta